MSARFSSLALSIGLSLAAIAGCEPAGAPAPMSEAAVEADPVVEESATAKGESTETFTTTATETAVAPAEEEALPSVATSPDE